LDASLEGDTDIRSVKVTVLSAEKVSSSKEINENKSDICKN
jgi:hypothetical protein